MSHGIKALVVDLIVGLALLASTSCLVAPAPPAGAQITCASDVECPGGTRCQVSVGLCVSGANLDVTVPALTGAVTLDPVRGGKQTVFTLSFDVSEKLAIDPVVEVDVGNGASAPFIVVDAGADHTDRSALHYVFTYAPSGSELAERPSAVTISLVDVARNPSAALAGGVITFDFTGPSFTGAPVVAPALLGPSSTSSTMHLTFTASEALANDATFGATAALDAGANGSARFALTLVGAPAAGDLTRAFDYVVDGSEPDGAYDVVVTLTDTSGNQSVDLRAGSVVIDNTLPAAQGADVRRKDNEASRDDAIPDVTSSTALVVAFAATEPLAESPVVRARCGASADARAQQLVRTGDLTSDVVFVYELQAPVVLDESLSAGDCAVTADLTDLAGNTVTDAVVASPAFTFDTAAPGAVDVDTPSRVVYRRVPWGDSLSPAHTFTVSGLAGAVEPFARVAAYDVVNAPADRAIAHVDADASGAFILELPPVDRALVFVAPIDSAGNEGARVVVKSVEWVATLGGKVAGSSFENPHRFEARTLFGANLAQANVIERAGEPALRDGDVATTRGASTWTDITTQTDEPDVEDPAATYDPTRGVVVLFGGSSCRCGVPNLAPCPDTWERKGALWHQLRPADPEGDGNPARRGAATLTFDPTRAASVLFGGAGTTFPSELNDTWQWDGASWRNVCTSAACVTSSPPPRTNHAAAYDPVRRRLVVFGGENTIASNNSRVLMNDTWEWDGAAWHQACVDAACAASAPPARFGHRMAYDPVTRRLLMFGGNLVASGVSFTNDLWAFDGSRWTQLCTDAACASAAPPVRSDAAVAFDPRASALVVFGGAAPLDDSCAVDSNTGTIQPKLADTWSFNGVTWTQLVPSDPEADGNPTPRHAAVMVDDPHQGHLVLISGVDTDPCFALECTHTNANDTWDFNGTSWRGVVEPAFPNANKLNPQPTFQGGRVDNGVAAYDAADDEVLLLLPTGEVDKWNGRWRPFNTNAQGQNDVVAHKRPAFSAEGTTVMLFGGDDGSDVTTANDVRIAAADFFFPTCFFGGCGAIPPARQAAAMALQSSSGSVVMFGGASDTNLGNPLGDTWVFNNANGGWTRQFVAGPAARDRASMAYDADRDVAVLFGGQRNDRGPDADSETWEWSGASGTWSLRTPATTSPAARRGAPMWFDSARHRVIMFGGDGSGFFGSNCGDGILACSDTLEWDGVDWSRPAIADPDDDGEPGERFDPAGAYHEGLQKAVMFGGNSEGNIGHTDTWEYDGGGEQRPGHVMFTVFAAAGSDGKEIIDDVEASFVAGGVGENEAAGAVLWVWDVDGWRALTQNAASSSSPAVVRWDGAETPLDGDSQDVLARLFFGTERELVFAVTPAEKSGGRAGFGEVTTDAAQVTVRYRVR